MGIQFDHDKYSAYLNQHLVAADAGVELFKAAATTWRETRWSATLDELHDEEVQAHARVKDLIESLGYDISSVRNAVSGAVAAMGRHNPLNPTRSREGRMTQAEMDALLSAIRGQQAMWETLVVLAGIDDRLDEADCARMVAVCEDQQARVRDMSQATVRERFLRPDDSSAHGDPGH